MVKRGRRFGVLPFFLTAIRSSKSVNYGLQTSNYKQELKLSQILNITQDHLNESLDYNLPLLHRR